MWALVIIILKPASNTEFFEWLFLKICVSFWIGEHNSRNFFYGWGIGNYVWRPYTHVDNLGNNGGHCWTLLIVEHGVFCEFDECVYSLKGVIKTPLPQIPLENVKTRDISKCVSDIGCQTFISKIVLVLSKGFCVNKS